MAVILAIIDGMTDDAVLAGRQPLDAAGAAHWERMRREGGYGVLRTAPPGRPVDSLGCIATLLGVPPASIPSGRACLEALAAGIALGPEDAACRCNLGRLDAAGNLAGSYWDAPEGAMETLCGRLSGDGMRLYPLDNCRALLVLRGAGGEARRLRLPPMLERLGLHPALPKGPGLAGRLRALAAASRGAAGGGMFQLVPWDLSCPQEIPAFTALHPGRTAACVTATKIVKGLCVSMGIPVHTPPGATADANTDLTGKAACALALAQAHPLVVVHVEGADELSHRGDAAGKAAFLARVDRELLGPLLAGGADALLACSDHTTLCRTGAHRGDPQPFALWRRGAAPAGDLGAFDGTAAIPLLAGDLQKGG